MKKNERKCKNEILNGMGVLIDPDSGKASFNPNVFIKYLLERQKMLIHEGTIFYQYTNGVWTQMPEHSLLRLMWEMFESAKANLYRTYMGSQALELLKLGAPETAKMNLRSDLINLQNGMLDLQAFELKEHAPHYYSTVQIPMKYTPEARCERFEKFVAEIMDDDVERVHVLQEMMGYLLTAETIIHKAFFLHGEGSNGKSLLLEIITMLVGEENVSNLTLTDLDSPFRRSSLIGKTVNIATENEISSKGFNSQYFKAIVSGDRIQVEKKYQDSISYTPTCKLVFAVNSLPHSSDKTHGLYRRMMILPFDRRFEGERADKRLKSKLILELPGILNWALVGLKRLRENNYEFSDSKAINNAATQYKAEQNPVADYIREMLEVVDSDSRIKKAQVLEGYAEWCAANGLGDVMKMSPQKFWKVFQANCSEQGVPYDIQTSNGIRYLKKINLIRREKNTFKVAVAEDIDFEI